MVLQTIREKLTGILAGVFFAVLIIPFAFVGVNSYFQADAVNSVAVVNDQEITINDFNQSFQQYRRQMQARLGDNFDAEEFDQPIVRRQHLDSMIDRELLAQLSFEAGLSVADDVLASTIRDIPAFQVGGVFNSDVYQASLAAQGMTPRQFENNTRSRMIMGQFPNAIANSAIGTSRELDNYVRLHNQKRAFSAVLVPTQSDDTATIDEQSIVAWYDAHPDDYRSEEQIVIEYLELDSAELGDSIAPGDEQLLAQFEEQKSRFISPETRLASHILIEVGNQAQELDIESARQVAEDLAERARAGEDFATLAKENSQDAGSAPEGGDLGWIEPGFMVQSFEDALYKLSPEKPISDPVQTGFGWHVIYLRDIRPAEGMTFAEARPILLEEYEADQNERRFLEEADRLVDIIYEDPTTLDAAAAELGLEIQQAGPFGRLGGEGVAASPAVVKASFSDLVMLQGVVSDPIDLADNHLIVIRMKEYLPETQLPLDDVRDRLVQSLRRQRAMERAQVRADEILAQVTSGADLSVVGAEKGLEVLVVEAATRSDVDVPQDLLRQLFLIKAPGEEGPVNEVLELTDGYAVVQLQSVSDGVLTAADVMNAQNYIRRITNATANNEAYGFMRMLRNQSEIRVFEERL